MNDDKLDEIIELLHKINSKLDGNPITVDSFLGKDQPKPKSARNFSHRQRMERIGALRMIDHFNNIERKAYLDLVTRHADEVIAIQRTFTDYFIHFKPQTLEILDGKKEPPFPNLLEHTLRFIEGVNKEGRAIIDEFKSKSQALHA